MDPFLFVNTRFGIATLVFLPFLIISKSFRTEIIKALPVGLLLGVVSAGIYFTQSVGLQTVSSPRAGFITSLYIILIPLLSPIFNAGKPTQHEWGSLGLALLGLFFLLNPKAESLGMGDLLIFASAILVAVHIHCVKKFSTRALKPSALAFWQIVVILMTSFLFVPWGSVHTTSFDWNSAAVISVLVCALVVTHGAFWLQTTCQKNSTPERTAVIFSLEPLFGAFFALMLLKESLSEVAGIGACLLLASVFVSTWGKKTREENQAAIDLS